MDRTRTADVTGGLPGSELGGDSGCYLYVHVACASSLQFSRALSREGPVVYERRHAWVTEADPVQPPAACSIPLTFVPAPPQGQCWRKLAPGDKPPGWLSWGPGPVCAAPGRPPRHTSRKRAPGGPRPATACPPRARAPLPAVPRVCCRRFVTQAAVASPPRGENDFFGGQGRGEKSWMLPRVASNEPQDIRRWMCTPVVSAFRGAVTTKDTLKPP